MTNIVMEFTLVSFMNVDRVLSASFEGRGESQGNVCHRWWELG
jgi:hypothetical protein